MKFITFAALFSVFIIASAQDTCVVNNVTFTLDPTGENITTDWIYEDDTDKPENATYCTCYGTIKESDIKSIRDCSAKPPEIQCVTGNSSDVRISRRDYKDAEVTLCKKVQCTKDLYSNFTCISFKTDISGPDPPGIAEPNFPDPWTVNISLAAAKPTTSISGYEFCLFKLTEKVKCFIEDNANATEAIFDDLDLRADYIFKLKAYNGELGKQITYGKEITKNFISPITVPPQPSGLKSGKITPTTIEFLWDPPDSKYIVDNYVISHSEQNTTLPGSETLFELNGLKPWTDYGIFVQACINDSDAMNCTKESSYKSRTKPTGPGRIEVNYTETESNITFILRKPAEENGIFGGFVLRETAPSKLEILLNSTDTITTYTLPDLSPFTNYCFQIFAFNYDNNIMLNGSVKTFFIMTDAAAPSKPELYHLTNDASIAYIKWNDTIWNGDEGLYEIESFPSESKDSDENRKFNVTYNSVTLISLNSETEYTVKITALNVQGYESETLEVKFKTFMQNAEGKATLIATIVLGILFGFTVLAIAAFFGVQYYRKKNTKRRDIPASYDNRGYRA